MANRDVFEWSDVLAFGSNPDNGFGYSWNQLHDILVNDEFPPMYEIHTRDYDISEFEYDGDPVYGYSNDTCDVVKAFMNSEGVTNMLITD